MIMFTEHFKHNYITVSHCYTIICFNFFHKVSQLQWSNEALVEMIWHGLWTKEQRDRESEKTLKTSLGAGVVSFL